MSGYKTNTFLLLTKGIADALFALIVPTKRRRKMKTKLVGLFLILAMIGIIAGSNPNEAKASQDGKTIKVVWLSFGLSHEWFHSLSIFAEHEARKIEKEDGVKSTKKKSSIIFNFFLGHTPHSRFSSVFLNVRDCVNF